MTDKLKSGQLYPLNPRKFLYVSRIFFLHFRKPGRNGHRALTLLSKITTVRPAPFSPNLRSARSHQPIKSLAVNPAKQQSAVCSPLTIEQSGADHSAFSR